MCSKLVRLETLAIVVLGLAVLLIWPTTSVEAAKPYSIDSAQSDCGSLQVEVLGGEPSPFILPRDAGQTLVVAAGGTLDVLVRNPPANGFLELRLAGVLGDVVQNRYPINWTGLVVKVVDVPISDYVRWGRGIFDVEVTLLDGSERPICENPARLRIDGFGGFAGYASVTAVTLAGLAVLANIIGNIKSGLQARIKVEVAIERRRRRGLRRWVPIPSLWRTIMGTAIGTVNGLALMVLLQQGGVTTLSLQGALTGLVIGGLAPVSTSVALGSVIGFLIPPKE